MANGYTADDVFEIAVQIERNGGAFYRRAAELSADADAKVMLADLAVMEDGHVTVFTAMREKLHKENPEWLSRAFAASSDDDPALYLQAAAKGRVFDFESEPAAQLTASHSLKDVLSIAVGLEKESVVFYVGIRDVVPDNRGKEQMDGIIREEMGHIALLSNRLKELGA